MGRREGCEEGVSRENTTPLLTNRLGANYTRSSNSKSPGICKIGSTSTFSKTFLDLKKKGAWGTLNIAMVRLVIA